MMHFAELGQTLLGQPAPQADLANLSAQEFKCRRGHTVAVSHLTVNVATQYPVNVEGLTSRRRVELDLPEFLLVALERFLADANSTVRDGHGDMNLTEFVTFHFVELLDPAEIEMLDREFPGFYDAVIYHLAGVRA